MKFPGWRQFLFAVVGLSGLCVGPVAAQPNTGTEIAALKKRLEALPLHAANFVRIQSLAGQLARLSPRRAPVWLKTALGKIAQPNSKRNVVVLTNQLNRIVEKSRLSEFEQRRVIRQNRNVLKTHFFPWEGIP